MKVSPKTGRPRHTIPGDRIRRSLYKGGFFICAKDRYDRPAKSFIQGHTRKEAVNLLVWLSSRDLSGNRRSRDSYYSTAITILKPRRLVATLRWSKLR